MTIQNILSQTQYKIYCHKLNTKYAITIVNTEFIVTSGCAKYILTPSNEKYTLTP